MPDSAPDTPPRRPPSPAGSLSGMGIAFHTANPLPPPLHDTRPPSAFPLLRSYSDDHRERQQNGRTLASHQTSSAGVPGSAAPSASSSGGNLNLRGGVHRNSFSHSSPADRAPTVPPAPPSHSSSAVRPSLPPLAAPRPAHAQTARPAPPTSSFAMSSSIGLQTNEPRGRVVSPQHGHPADSPSPSPPAPHTMSLLASILGFSAFGFGARCLQLGLQKRPIFDGEPRPPAPPLTPL